jgi:hypothetical protein
VQAWSRSLKPPWVNRAVPTKSTKKNVRYRGKKKSYEQKSKPKPTEIIKKEEPKAQPIIDEEPKAQPITDEEPKAQPITDEEPKAQPITEEELIVQSIDESDITEAIDEEKYEIIEEDDDFPDEILEIEDLE